MGSARSSSSTWAPWVLVLSNVTIPLPINQYGKGFITFHLGLQCQRRAWNLLASGSRRTTPIPSRTTTPDRSLLAKWLKTQISRKRQFEPRRESWRLVGSSHAGALLHRSECKLRAARWHRPPQARAAPVHAGLGQHRAAARLAQARVDAAQRNHAHVDARPPAHRRASRVARPV